MLDSEPMSLEQLEQQLIAARQQYQNLGVVVRGDAAAVYQYIADVLAACRKAEINDLGISVRVARKE